MGIVKDRFLSLFQYKWAIENWFYLVNLINFNLVKLIKHCDKNTLTQKVLLDVNANCTIYIARAIFKMCQK